MKSNISGGKIFFFKTDKSQNPKDCFSSIFEVNSNFDNLKSLNLTNGKAYGITVNDELLEWEFEKKKTHNAIPISNPQENTENSSNISPSKALNKKNDFYFLLTKPSYRFHKLKIKSISLNKTMCLSLDTNGNVLVWGQNKDGLLGLGYEVNSVDNPTILDGLVDIVDISLSDYHAVALNSSGIPFSWGLGKYGELGLERSIYSPVPQQMNTEGLYSRVFCGNLITCFLDFDGHFSYFGVIIKQLSGNSSTVTTKNLLNDQNIDSKSIFLEKEFEELEDQKFKEIIIGNGFIGLLGNTGTLFTLEYNDKLTMLYSKYYLYNIVVAKNAIFGLAKDNVKILENKNNLNQNNLINTSDEKIKTNYYLCKWSSKSSSENEVSSDIWITTIWKFKEEFSNIIGNSKLLDTNDNKSILLLLDMDEKYRTNLNTSVLNPNKKLLDLSANNDLSQLDKSMNNNTTIEENIMMFNLNKKKLPEKFLDYEAEFDDSFNLKYKRTKAKSRSILKDLPYIGTIRSRSQSKFLNKSYNASFQNSDYNLNKSNFLNFGNNNISAIGLNTSGFMNKKSFFIPTGNNYKKGNPKVFTNNLRNYNNKNKKDNSNQNNKGNLFLNNNDLNKDNNELDNNYNENDIINNENKNEYKEKEKENANIHEESIDVKERELNKYRSEIDDIIANYKNKQNIKKNNLMNKYGLSKENNINIVNKKQRENDKYNQNLSKDYIIDFNIKDHIDNSKNNNISDYVNIDNKRYDEENNLNNNIKGNKEKDKKQNLNNKNIQSSGKKGFNNNIMKSIKQYFQINKVNSQKNKKNIKRNKSENEIQFDANRQETFQDVNNNRREYNSLIINNPLNLFITNSEMSELVPTRCLSEGNDILNNISNENEDNYNEDDTQEKNNMKYKDNYFQNKNNDINIIGKNGKKDYDSQLISSPAFNNGDNQKNRVNNLNKRDTNKKNTDENMAINIKGKNKSKEIVDNKNNDFNNLAKRNIINTNKNQNNSNFEKLSKGKYNLVTQNINNINLKGSKNQNEINNKKDLMTGKNEINKISKNKNASATNTNNNDDKNISNKERQSNNNIKISQGSKNTKKNTDKNNQKKVPSNQNNYQKNINYINKKNDTNEENNNTNLKEKLKSKNNQINKDKTYSNKGTDNNYVYISGKKKDTQNDTNEENKEKDYNNLPFKLEDNEKRNKNDNKKKNTDNYNFIDFNEEQKDKKNNKYGDREPDLNNCDFEENDMNNIYNDKYEKEQNSKNNNKKNMNIYQRENIYSYNYGDNNQNKKNKNNNIIEVNKNNISYKGDDLGNKNKLSNTNKHKITYFCYIISYYMKKKSYAMCVYEIANFQKKYEKTLSLKLLFIIIKKRIIFYKIKFFHRYKKIYKYMVKYKNVSIVKSGEKKKLK